MGGVRSKSYWEVEAERQTALAYERARNAERQTASYIAEAQKHERITAQAQAAKQLSISETKKKMLEFANTFVREVGFVVLAIGAMGFVYKMFKARREAERAEREQKFEHDMKKQEQKFKQDMEKFQLWASHPQAAEQWRMLEEAQMKDRREIEMFRERCAAVKACADAASRSRGVQTGEYLRALEDSPASATPGGVRVDSSSQTFNSSDDLGPRSAAAQVDASRQTFNSSDDLGPKDAAAQVQSQVSAPPAPSEDGKRDVYAPPDYRRAETSSQAISGDDVRPGDSASQVHPHHPGPTQGTENGGGGPADSGLAASSACSSLSCGAFSLISAPQPQSKGRCFLQGTHLHVEGGRSVAVEELQSGSRIVGATDRLLTVMRVDKHMLEDQRLVELKTDTGAELTVTSSHLVMAITNQDPASSTLRPQPTAAERLREGDLVCTNFYEKATLTSVEIKEPEAECQVYSVFFKPNEPVLSFHCPPKQVQTCGSSATPKGKTRRSGMNRRGRSNCGNDQEITIPATFDEYQ